jgi:serine/threonine-protein kinase
MGVVYLARDVQLDRDVAIKVLPDHLATTAEARERFVREARMAAGLSHPHIVPIHRVGEAGGFVFFVMSYVAGETLGERLRTRGPLPPAGATRVLREVAWALAYAHGRGIVHRDIKPDNILLEAGTGRALVTDFGIAHGGGDPGSVTDPGKIMGTAHFMSPEQAAGEAIDGRSDIYALGVVGYLAVSGRLPFESKNLPHCGEPGHRGAAGVALALPGPSRAGRGNRPCLARDPALRFADGEALAKRSPRARRAAVTPAHPAAWLRRENPLLVPYMAWSGVWGTPDHGHPDCLAVRQAAKRPADIVVPAAIASLPLLPVIVSTSTRRPSVPGPGTRSPTCGRPSTRRARAEESEALCLVTK